MVILAAGCLQLLSSKCTFNLSMPEGKAFYGWEIMSTDGVPMGGDDVVYIRREEERVSDTDLLISALDPKKEYTYKTVYKEFSNWKKLDKGDADNEYFEAEFKRAT